MSNILSLGTFVSLQKTALKILPGTISIDENDEEACRPTESRQILVLPLITAITEIDFFILVFAVLESSICDQLSSQFDRNT